MNPTEQPWMKEAAAEISHKAWDSDEDAAKEILAILAAHAPQQWIPVSASNVELRPDDPTRYKLADRTVLDEVCASNVKSVHVERMDDNCYWMGLNLADGRHVRVTFSGKKRSTIYCLAEIEEADPLPAPPVPAPPCAPPLPFPFNEAVFVMDGNKVCAHRYPFTNLMEMPAGFGDTALQAFEDLCRQERAAAPSVPPGEDRSHECPTCSSRYTNTRGKVSDEPGKKWCVDLWHAPQQGGNSR